MSFDMTSIKTEPGSNGDTGALFEGLAVPADSAAVLKRSTPQGVPRVQSAVRCPQTTKPAPSGPSCSPLIFKPCTRRSVPSKAASGARPSTRHSDEPVAVRDAGRRGLGARTRPAVRQ